MFSRRSNILTIIFLLTVIITLTKCANPTAPTGGPKDTLAPRLKTSYPSYKQTNFQGKEIRLLFDDRVNSDALLQELIINPQLKKKYKLQTTARGIKITLDEDLQPNTTYTLSFRKSIKDYTEGNITKNLTLLFSTGQYIDSSSIKGNVKYLITKSPITEPQLLLFSTNVDSIKSTTKPAYITTGTPTGEFTFENIANKNYFLLAYQDINKNLTWDSNSEHYFKKYLTLDSNNTYSTIYIFPKDTTQNIIRESDQKKKSISLKIGRPITNCQIKPLQNSPNAYFTFNKQNITIYPEVKADTTKDTLRYEITTTDSSQITTKDTLLYEYVYKLIPNRLGVEFAQTTINQTDIKKYRLNFDTPVNKINETEIELQFDNKNFYLNEIKHEWNEAKTELVIQPPYTCKDSVKIKIESKSLTSIYNDTNAVYQNKIELKEEESKGSISFTVDCKYKNYIIQLLRDDFSVVESFYNLKNIKLKNLAPDRYTIRIIEDSNSNFRWDIEPFPKALPERIYYYPEKLQLKANWELNDITIRVED